MLGNKIHSHSHTPAADNVQVLDTEATPQGLWITAGWERIKQYTLNSIWGIVRLMEGKLSEKRCSGNKREWKKKYHWKERDEYSKGNIVTYST